MNSFQNQFELSREAAVSIRSFGFSSVKPIFLAVALLASSSSLALADFGAIAFSSSDGAYGYGYNYANRRAAENRAMTECENHGGDHCKIVMWVKDACAALAIGTGNGWATEWRTGRGNAENAALRSCERNTDSCEIK
eukprot:gene7361-7429_t